jgi:2-phosphosulfolactate phosphatase
MTQPSLEVLLAPAELTRLAQMHLSRTVCVVFDILRATTTMMVALANGADAIRPVAEISEALALKQQDPNLLLAGERNGVRIEASLTGGVPFDLGNSPREFTAEIVQGKTIVMTTTNGTRALRACAGAQQILLGSFLNLRATAQWLRQHHPLHLILVCSGTQDQPALEDILAAGALCERIWAQYSHGQTSDGAEVARRLYPLLQANLVEAMRSTRNGRRLLAHPELRDDIWFCVQREIIPFVAGITPYGTVQRLN